MNLTTALSITRLEFVVAPVPTTLALPAPPESLLLAPGPLPPPTLPLPAPARQTIREIEQARLLADLEADLVQRTGVTLGTSMIATYGIIAITLPGAGHRTAIKLTIRSDRVIVSPPTFGSTLAEGRRAFSKPINRRGESRTYRYAAERDDLYAAINDLVAHHN